MRPKPALVSGSSTTSPAPVASQTSVTPVSRPKALHETWIDHLILLLHVAAGVEHELMVQYLYAAYSLNRNQERNDQRQLVELWQRNLLAIAKEEMGHFLTVQNILTVLGAPTLWTRGSHPWDDAYFPLRRHAFTQFDMGALSCYVYAEAPAHISYVANRYYGIDREAVRRIVDKVRRQLHGQAPHRVEQLYAKVIDVIKNPKLVPDSAFHAETYSAQACWEEWGRGYKPPPFVPANAYNRKGPPAKPLEILPTAAQAHVIVSQVASRTEVLDALQAVGEQGEAPDLNPNTKRPSHFDRFIAIYEKFEKITWTPTHDVAPNPTTRQSQPDSTYIESEHSRDWANLFNLRYRMLLTYLAHMYRLLPADRTRRQRRAGTLHRVFSEMYNLRAIANLLVRLPLTDDPNDPRRAGPPFELPYTLALPVAEDDCWRLHRELLVNSEMICNRLLPNAPLDGRLYLKALCDLDRQSMAWLDAMLQGHSGRKLNS